jgi:squalene-hopene/tetraprenyl-beta-curcumene cyclase
MFRRSTLLFVTGVLPLAAADWNPKLAAGYLDARQKEWFAWSVAKAPGGVCISCHTGMTYLMARPMLRKVLGETGPTEYETGLLASLRARVEKRDVKEVSPLFPKEPAASQAMGVESIFAAMFLRDDAAVQKKAFDRLFSLQVREGEFKGVWPWFSLNLNPWEMPESGFYGSTLAAMAIGSGKGFNREPAAALAAYLKRETPNQPLHNRLMALQAPERFRPEPPEKVMAEAFRAQQPDGGWTLESLGPWKKQEAAPAQAGSNAYATAFAAYSLAEGGIARSNPAFARALEWLKLHQDRETGFWDAASMNKMYPPDSMMIRFMRDAATAYASMALLTDQFSVRPR